AAGVTRLGDFGVAHLGDLSTTATAGVIGTLAYMRPEQREGRPATVKSDIFGVGVLLRGMLTAERPLPHRPPRTGPIGIPRRRRAALDRLHQAGVAHGAIDAAHVVVGAPGDVMLRFEAEHSSTWTPDLDRALLAGL